MRYNLTINTELTEAQDFLNSSAAREKTIEMKVVRAKRSLKSNAYLHLLLQICGSEWGYNLPEMKTLYKRDIAPSIYVYFKNDMPFIRSSADLNNKEMSDSIELLKKYAAEQDLVLPEPTDEAAMRHWELQIEKDSKYL